MKLRVLFFGATANAVGLREHSFKLVDGVTVADVVKKLSQDFPRLGDHKLVIAVNEEYADLDLAVGDDDTIAIFTAVSGG